MSGLSADVLALESPDDGFNVVNVPGLPGYRVGRGAGGSMVVLTPPDAQPGPPIRLRCLDLDPRALCRTAVGSEVTEQDHGVVIFRPDRVELIEPVFEVASAIMRLLGPDPGPGDVTATLRRLVDLFTADHQPTGSVVGLWGELWVIEQGDDPAALVDAWHSSVDERFDFALDGVRIEVKTTTLPDRVHTFSLDQLLPMGLPVTVVSIMTTRTDLGTSLRDLVSRLEVKLALDPKRQLRVHEMIAATLGAHWADHAATSFDETQATQSLRTLDAASVPRVEPGPMEVVRVELTVNCAGVRPI